MNNDADAFIKASRIITAVAMSVVIVGAIFIGTMIMIYFKNIDKIRTLVVDASETSQFMERRLENYYRIMKDHGDSLRAEKRRNRELTIKYDSLLHRSRAQSVRIKMLEKRLKDLPK